MTISLRAAGTVTSATAAVTAVSPAVPTGTTTGDLSVLTVSIKPYTATVTAPAGWTQIGQAASGTVAGGADSGSMRIAVFVRESAPVGAIGNLAISGGDSASAVIHSYTRTAGVGWDFLNFAAASDTTATGWSASSSTDLGLMTGDMVIAASALNTDAGTATVPAITAAGSTFGTATIRTDVPVTTGNDSGLVYIDRPVTGGYSTGGPAVTFTNSSLTTTSRGLTFFLRLREARPKIETLVDDFSVDARSTNWPNSYGLTAVTGGRGTVSGDAANQYSGLQSLPRAFDLRNSYVSVKFTAPTGTGLYSALTMTQAAAGNDISALWSAGNILLGQRIAYSHDAPYSVPLAAGASLYVGWGQGVAGAARFGKNDGAANSHYWFTSPDGITWTLQRTGDTPVYADAVTVLLEAGEGTGTAAFDDFNVIGSANVSHTGSVALTGAGTLTTSRTPGHGGSLGGTGAGNLTGTGTPAPTQTGALSGSGTLSTTRTPGHAQTEALSGAGTLSTSRTPEFRQSTDSSGSGDLSLTGSPGAARTLSLTGSGTLSTARTPRPTGTLAGSGSGTLGGAPTLTFTGGIDLSGEGVLEEVAIGLTVLAPRWSEAKQLAVTGQGTADALSLGDSTTLGFGTGGVVESYPYALRDLLGPIAETGMVIPSSTASVVDPRWAVGTGIQSNGDWAISGSFGWGNRSSYRAASNTVNDLVFTPGYSFDTVDFYYITSNTNATAPVFVGGVQVGALVGGGGKAPGWEKATLTVPAGSTDVTLKPPGGNFWIGGIHARTADRAAISVSNAGASGSQTNDWVSGSYASTKGIAAFAPDLTILSLGINDSTAAVPVATYKANLRTIIVQAQVSGDVIVWTNPPSLDISGRVALQRQYRTAVYELAGELGFSVVDIFARWGSHEAANAAGWMSDNVHPSAAGYDVIAAAIHEAVDAATIFASGVALTGAGTLATTRRPGLTRTQSLTGSGTLSFTGTATRVGSLALSGDGTLAQTPGLVTARGSRALTGAGTLTTSRIARAAGSAELSGEGVLGDTGTPSFSRTLARTGSGTLTGFRSSAYTGGIARTGSGTLSTTRRPAPARTLSLSGAGTLSLPRVVNTAGTLPLSGAGTLTRQPLAGIAGRSLALRGAGTLTFLAQPNFLIKRGTVTGALLATGTASGVRAPTGSVVGSAGTVTAATTAGAVTMTSSHTTAAPWTTVTLTATGKGTWAQVAGPRVTLVPTATGMSFVTPASLTATSVVVAFGSVQRTIAVSAAKAAIKTASGIIPMRLFRKA